MFTKWNRHPFFSPDDGGGDGGDDNAPDEKGKDIEALVAKAVAKETDGLKRTNQALKDEKKQLQEKFETLTGIVEKIGGEEGATALLEMRQRFEKDKLGKLLAEGKTDEWLQAQVANLKGEHEQTVTKLKKEIEDRDGRASAAETALADLNLNIAVRDACATSEGFRKEAVPDALLWAKSRFQFDHERGIPVRRDENGTVILGKDGESPLTIAEDLEHSKETRRHWWETSQGAGAGGGVGGGGAGSGPAKTLDEWRQRRKELGMDNDSRIPG